MAYIASIYSLRAVGLRSVPSIARLNTSLLPCALIVQFLTDNLILFILLRIWLKLGAESSPKEPIERPSDDSPQNLLIVASDRINDYRWMSSFC